MAAVRPARIIGYDRVIPPLVLLVDRHHVRSCRLGDGGHHQADGGPPHSRGLAFILPIVRRSAHPIPVRPDMVDLDLRVGTEVLMPRRSLWSRETTLDCGEHHEAGTIRRRKDGPDGLDRPEKSTARANAGMNSAWAGLTGYFSPTKVKMLVTLVAILCNSQLCLEKVVTNSEQSGITMTACQVNAQIGIAEWLANGPYHEWRLKSYKCVMGKYIPKGEA